MIICGGLLVVQMRTEEAGYLVNSRSWQISFVLPPNYCVRIYKISSGWIFCYLRLIIIDIETFYVSGAVTLNIYAYQLIYNWYLWSYSHHIVIKIYWLIYRYLRSLCNIHHIFSSSHVAKLGWILSTEKFN